MDFIVRNSTNGQVTTNLINQDLCEMKRDTLNNIN